MAFGLVCPNAICKLTERPSALPGSGGPYLARPELYGRLMARTSLAARATGYRRCPGPKGFRERVWKRAMLVDAEGLVPVALVPVALVNDQIGLCFLVGTRQGQLRCTLQRQTFRLTHGEARRYDCRLAVLDGPAIIAGAGVRIRGIARQRDSDHPNPPVRFVRHDHFGRTPG